MWGCSQCDPWRRFFTRPKSSERRKFSLKKLWSNSQERLTISSDIRHKGSSIYLPGNMSPVPCEGANEENYAFFSNHRNPKCTEDLCISVETSRCLNSTKRTCSKTNTCWRVTPENIKQSSRGRRSERIKFGFLWGLESQKWPNNAPLLVQSRRTPRHPKKWLPQHDSEKCAGAGGFPPRPKTWG